MHPQILCTYIDLRGGGSGVFFSISYKGRYHFKDLFYQNGVGYPPPLPPPSKSVVKGRGKEKRIQSFSNLKSGTGYYQLSEPYCSLRPDGHGVRSVFQDPDDLPFKKGEILTVVSKDEEQWWTARHKISYT
jgi:hypothetical protein